METNNTKKKKDTDLLHENENKLLKIKKSVIHPCLRLSLFPNVPPYIKFSDNKTKLLPPSIRKMLLWKHSKITPYVVRNVVTNTGFEILNESIIEWSGVWTNQRKCTAYRKLHNHQKFNHLPGTVEIGRKDNLWRNIQVKMLRYGQKQFNIMPITFVLPRERKKFQNEWAKNNTQTQCWIIKPPASYRGDGIKLVYKYKQVPTFSTIIAQKYVWNPYLINETKFDLRLYVLLTSVNPLQLYWYKNGIVRFASTKYSTDTKSLNNRYIHLTNYSVNKHNEKYIVNVNANSCEGHKWTIETLWKYLEEQHQVDINQLQRRLIDLIIKTVICGENGITRSVIDHLRSRYNAYELFGFDVILDENLKPWLLEVNISPSLEASSPLDRAVKGPLMQEILNIVGFHIPVNKKIPEKQLAARLGKPPVSRLYLDNRIYFTSLSYSEKHKQSKYVKKKRKDYLQDILNSLTPDDVRHLISYEDELTQLKSFKKIFPTHKTCKYFKYFDKQRYYNQLLDAWENKYHENREEGRNVLKALCEKGFHLRTAGYIRQQS